MTAGKGAARNPGQQCKSENRPRTNTRKSSRLHSDGTDPSFKKVLTKESLMIPLICKRGGFPRGLFN